ncbi:hypothetical protein BHE74_00006547 [Ensete ventricosum]|nr:hypothetical protein BHE74_00006547 [Ensete ventricosum]
MGNKQSANRSGTLKKGDLDATDDPANFGRETMIRCHQRDRVPSPWKAVTRRKDRRPIPPSKSPVPPPSDTPPWFSSEPTSNWETLSDDAKSREAQGNLVFKGIGRWEKSRGEI